MIPKIFELRRMNKSLAHLSEVAGRENRRIAGLMSGTSLDGLDIALCRIGGGGRTTRLELERFKTVQYPPETVERLEPVVSVEEVSLRRLTQVHTWLGRYHGSLLLDALEEWEVRPEEVDAVGSHGQTAYHAPQSLHGQKEWPDATLQIGDGDQLARTAGIITISDFRQKHIAAGGEGAPLASLVDRMLYAGTGASRLLLNIGGIANFTWLPAGGGEPISTDTGPGNILINKFVQRASGEPFDRDGERARRGTVHAGLLRELLEHPWLKRPVPRTTGPEMFNLAWVDECAERAGFSKTEEDMVATLTWFSAETIAKAVRRLPRKELPEIYVSGGGVHNPVLRENLRHLLEGAEIMTTEALGMPPDAKEAAIFAVLANELLAGEGFVIASRGHAGRRVNLGKISFPV
ncbi:MAG: anhydro-N-acetylmuramic acid kinase [Balneolaceae bacterium]|nr:anhydro-N-acetylmuramic acid kinase [Balneolaceae bacterium]